MGVLKNYTRYHSLIFGMLIQTWGEVFSSSLQGLWIGFIQFVPNLLVAIIIFIVGWVIGAVLGKAIGQVIRALKIDALFKNIGAEEILSKAGLKLDIGGFIGWLVKWFIIIVFLITSLDILGLSQVNEFLSTVVIVYLPKVIVAALILILAGVISSAARNVVVGSVKAVGVKKAKFFGSVAYYAIWIFAFIIALSELGIAAQFMQIIFIGIVVTLSLAVGLSFGIGGRDAASRVIDKLGREVSNRQE